MVVKLMAALCLLHLFSSSQLGCQAGDLSMISDVFDDQYLGCAEEMEREMPEILEEEKIKYHEFSVRWDSSKQHWEEKRKDIVFPDQFKDEYGVAVVLYTRNSPIYGELNRNVSIAGQSRLHYMNNFHFKALHFYLTRALQVLNDGCPNKHKVFRGTDRGNIIVSPEFRFGQFASSSFSYEKAARFGKNPFYNISTSFGVDINIFSDYEELEVLIPVAEKFENIRKLGNTYEVETTGQLCSNFNCAYLGGEKRSEPVCNSAPGMFLYPDSRTPIILSGLSVILNIVFITVF
ncbi:ecto-ADP-ribosyltransferase 5-like [Mixophyes fleayi]|uniref:ecto-ADP-ribosyltransferase 5-like n=1 Tax=Mixophyes fleayi TaxID=3061075 RepID=UPI003F4DA231